MARLAVIFAILIRHATFIASDRCDKGVLSLLVSFSQGT